MSDEMAVLQYIKTHGSITTKEAYEELGCTRLSGRVFDLRKHGYNIQTDIIEVPKRHGKTARVARYYLIKEEENGRA